MNILLDRLREHTDLFNALGVNSFTQDHILGVCRLLLVAKLATMLTLLVVAEVGGGCLLLCRLLLNRRVLYESIDRFDVGRGVFDGP